MNARVVPFMAHNDEGDPTHEDWGRWPNILPFCPLPSATG